MRRVVGLCLIGVLLVLASVTHAATIVAATGAAGNWTSGSAWIGGVAPTAADDAQITATTTSLTINSGAVARSVDFTGCGAGCTITHSAAVTLTIGTTTAGLSNIALKMSATMIYTLGNATTSAISFVSTSGTQQTITTAGITLGNVTINGAGSSYQLSDNLTSSGSFTYTAGTTFDTATGSRIITLNGASPTFAGNGKTYYELDITGSGGAIVTGVNTFTNFNRTGTAVKTDTIQFNANQTVTGIFTLAGNSVTNRLMLKSDVLGTQRTITNSGATMTWSHVDLRDIQLGTSFNAAAITGLSGDCGGNGNNITFTTPATQTATGTASFTWSTHGWTSRVPLPQDNVVINNAFVSGRVVTLDMPRAGKSIDWSGATWTGTAPNWSLIVSPTMYGSLTRVAGMTQSAASVTFEGRGAFTLTNAGISWTNGIVVSMVGGTLTLQDALTSTSSLSHNNGTFVDNGFATAFTQMTSNSGFTRALTLSGTMTLTGTGVVWTVSGGGNTLMLTGSTIIVSESTQGTSKTFTGGNFTYGALVLSGKNIIIVGTNTFSSIALNNLGDTTGVTFPASTITTTSAFTTTASAGNVAKLISSTPSTAATLSKASGTVSVDYVSITDSAATGGAAWYAGPLSHSTDGGGNTGWIFLAPPLSGSGYQFAGEFLPQFTQRGYRNIDRQNPMIRTHPLSKGLLLWYLLIPYWNELGGSGPGTVMHDLTRNIDGVYTNMAVAPTSTSGPNRTERVGAFGEVRYDGVNDNITSKAAVPITGNFSASIALMAKFTSFGGTYKSLAAFVDAAGSNGLALMQNAGAGSGSLGAVMYSSRQCQTGTGVITTGIWYHLIAVKLPGVSAPTNTFIYVNGQPQVVTCSGGGSPNVNAATFYVASDVGAEVSNVAAIDDVRLYNRALAPQEATALAMESLRGNPTTLRHMSIQWGRALAGALGIMRPFTFFQ